jgi:nitrite reductase/ring-hydroxylating ferredoxin subunit
MLTERELLERQLADRVGPILSDGTPFRELFDLEKREISMRVLADPELYRLELKYVFARSWCAVGHVSEIPNAGDFVLRHIGEDPVIVTRTRSGDITCMLNVCAHRGMEVCWADEGNANQFKCPYHGWVYDGEGKLLGAPFEQEMYGDWDKSQFALRTAKVDTRCGVIFANFDKSSEPLDEWFGEFGWYFDIMYGKGVEMESIGKGGQRMRVPANWKAAAEQNSGDGYHTVTLHAALRELGMLIADPSDAKGLSLDCHDISSREGHGIRCVEYPPGAFFSGDHEQKFPVGWFMAGLMFPTVNVGGQIMPNPATADGLLRTANLGVMMPTGPGQYEQWFVSLIQKDAPDELKNMTRRGSAMFAAIGADDFESWPSMTRVARGAITQEETIKYNAILGEHRPDDWPGPALVHRGFSKDDNQWHFWLRYFDLMTSVRT